MGTGDVEGLQEVAQQFRRRVQERREALRRETGNRPLGVNAPPACPKDLAGRIDAHDLAVVEWERAWETLADDAADLTLAIAKPDVRGVALAEKAAGLRSRRYDLAQRLVGLIGDRSKLLEAIREHLAPLIEVAEADVAKAQDKAEKALTKAAWLSQAERVAPGQHPQAAAQQLAAEARRTESVRKPAGALTALRTADAQARDILGAQARDQEAAQGEALAAWRTLVGPAV